MRRNLFVGLACAGAFWCLQAFSMALAQTAGSAPSGQAPSTPSTFPGQTAPTQPNGAGSPMGGNSAPGVNGPKGPNTPDATSMPAKMDDKKFVKDAAIGGMTEVELRKLAAQKASRDDVKQFGQKMVDDHTKANDQLKQLASKQNIPIPEGLDSKSRSRIDKLSQLSGPEFDKAYLKDQLKDHQTDIKEFSAEAQGGTDAAVKAFASSVLPTLQEHLDIVKGLNKSEKKKAEQTR